MSDEVEIRGRPGEPEAEPVAEEQAKGCPPAAGIPAPPPSPEEQMDAFEDSLKESDWGHQPC